MILHGIYVIINAYGWYHWSDSKNSDTGIPVTVFNFKERLLLTVVVMIGSAAWGYFMHTNTTADFAFADAFILVTSLIAQYLLAVKKLENWVLWIAVDIIAIYIYAQKGLKVTYVLYSIYLLLCILGYRSWSISLNKRLIRN